MAPKDGVDYTNEDVMNRLALLEEKVDRLLGFAALVEKTAAPFLKGRSAKYLALFAKSSPGGGK